MKRVFEKLKNRKIAIMLSAAVLAVFVGIGFSQGSFSQIFKSEETSLRSTFEDSITEFYPEELNDGDTSNVLFPLRSDNTGNRRLRLFDRTIFVAGQSAGIGYILEGANPEGFTFAGWALPFSWSKPDWVTEYGMEFPEYTGGRPTDITVAPPAYTPAGDYGVAITAGGSMQYYGLKVARLDIYEVLRMGGSYQELARAGSSGSAPMLGDTIRLDAASSLPASLRTDYTTVTYQWQISSNGTSDWTDIAGATGESLEIDSTSYLGKYIRLGMTFTQTVGGQTITYYNGSYGTTTPLYSSATAQIENNPEGAPPTFITSTTLPTGHRSSEYNLAFQTNGIGTIRYALVEGTTASQKLPTGIAFSVDRETGIASLNGMPTVYGTFTFTINLSSAFGSSSRTFTLELLKEETTVSFDANGGTPTSQPLVEMSEEHYKLPGEAIAGSTAKAPGQVPTWSGHTFIGWYTAPTGGTRITTASIVATPEAANFYPTLYAHWEENKRFISFDRNGVEGEELEPVTAEVMYFRVVDSAGNATILPTPSAPYEGFAGLSFKGWYTAAEGGEKINENTYIESPTMDSITLYAHWRGTNGSAAFTLYVSSNDALNVKDVSQANRENTDPVGYADAQALKTSVFSITKPTFYKNELFTPAIAQIADDSTERTVTYAYRSFEKGKYVSAAIFNATGEVVYYWTFSNGAAQDTSRAQVTISLPAADDLADIPDGWTFKVFAEERNHYNEIDFVSELLTVQLPNWA